MNTGLSEEVLAKIDRWRAAKDSHAQARQLAPEFGGFRAFVNHWEQELSDAATRLNALYGSITIWEVYKRLLPNKPHTPYRRDEEVSCACPHEEGKKSLSMSINDAAGVYFCFHNWEGGNKMSLYCEIRGLKNEAQYFHNLKRMMVWEFRHEDPYAMVEQCEP